MDAATQPPKTSPLSGLGPALRRLRMRRGLRQFETAEAAKITKAMLSAYENGKRRPSLKTLDQIMAALEADLGDLHHALVTERRERARAAQAADAAQPAPGGAPLHQRPADELGEPPPRYDDFAPPADPWRELAWTRSPEVDLYRALGIRAPLPPAEERALSEMLVGFLKLLRFLHAGGGNAAG
jgi:transcriptional regulator with XRE-family HTH domain